MEPFDDATLRKQTLLAVLAMGGGCALLLAFLGAGSMWIARTSDPHPAATATSVTTADGAAAALTDLPARAPATPKLSDRHSKAPSSI